MAFTTQAGTTLLFLLPRKLYVQLLVMLTTPSSKCSSTSGNFWKLLAASALNCMWHNHTVYARAPQSVTQSFCKTAPALTIIAVVLFTAAPQTVLFESIRKYHNTITITCCATLCHTVALPNQTCHHDAKPHYNMVTVSLFLKIR